MWVLAVVLRRKLKHIPTLIGVLIANSLLLTQAYTQGGQSVELGDPQGGPMDQLLTFGAFDAFNMLAYLVPNYYYSRRSMLMWVLGSKTLMLGWFVVRFDNRVNSCLASYTLTTVAAILVASAMKRVVEERSALAKDEIGTVDIYIMVFLDLPYQLASALGLAKVEDGSKKKKD